MKAPPPPLFNWSGFYVGLHGGYGWGRSQFDAPVAGTGTFNVDGWLFGGLAGLLTGLLPGGSREESARIANACGAIVVSRHGCTPAMPTPAELAHWFSGRRSPRVDSDRELAHLHRVSPRRADWPELQVMAFDHRSQFYELARSAGAPESRLPTLKRLLVRAAGPASPRRFATTVLGAGATIQAQYLVRGSVLGNTEMMAEGYERGLAFLPGAAVDQHFTQRKRQPDMELLKRTYPQLLGLGIDEGTAAVIRGSKLEVLGSVERLEVSGVLNFTKHGDTSQLKAIAHYAGGVSKDVTNDVVWDSSDRDVVAITNTGTATAKGDGDCDITAVLGSITAKAAAKVRTQRIVRLRIEGNLSLALLGQLSHLKAIAALDEGHRQFPDRVPTATTLARLLASSPDRSLRDGQRALDLAMTVYDREPSPVHRETVALALSELGRCDEAADWMTRAIAEAERAKDKSEAARLKGELTRYTTRPCRP